MTYEEWVNSHDIQNWIIDPEKQLSRSTPIEYYKDGVVLEWVWNVNNYSVELMSGRTINTMDTVCYLSKAWATVDTSTQTKCTCGAKHTSSPNFHLPYCDIK